MVGDGRGMVGDGRGAFQTKFALPVPLLRQVPFRCLFQCLFPSCFQLVFGSVFYFVLADICAISVSFRVLVRTF